MRNRAAAIKSTTLPEGGAGAAQRLTDVLFGSFESWSAPDVNWIAYKGVHMDFVLDLGAVMPVQTVTMNFLNAQAQPDWNLRVLPRYVTHATRFATLAGLAAGCAIVCAGAARSIVARNAGTNFMRPPELSDARIACTDPDATAEVKTVCTMENGAKTIACPKPRIT